MESAANRMALRAARSVAAAPGTKYNPLVITGASGNGKTHLLHGLGNALAASGLAVACVSGNEFVDELISAIERDAVGLWRARYRQAGALLIDDVHVVAGKDRSQEEFFVLFNHLMERGGQMVFTSSVPLADLEALEPRLRTRLEGGLVVELPAPDRELRERAIERMLSARLESVDPEFVSYVAGRPADSMRASLALAQRVLHAAEAKQTAPTAGLARDVLEGAARPRQAQPAGPSGVTAPSAAGVRSREKMVWEWPDLAARMIEELR
jgi:chromosomal replication initiator protein